MPDIVTARGGEREKKSIWPGKTVILPIAVKDSGQERAEIG